MTLERSDMPATNKNLLPQPVIQRLPKYLTHVLELKGSGESWVSSGNMALSLGLTSSTVRQDLSHLNLSGVSKRGYELNTLENALREVLGTEQCHRLIIVGAGYLGSALALHGGMLQYGFTTCGIFDKDPEVVGHPVGRLKVEPMKNLRSVVSRKKVDIGIIAVPAVAAQEVADHLVEAGVSALLNLAYAHIRVPRHVSVIDARLLASLQELAYLIRNRDGSGGGIR